MTDVYKVGVSLVMTGNFAQVLGALSSKLLGISNQTKELEKGFGKLGVAITGALGAFASTKVLETMGTMVKYGDQLVHQQNLLQAAGASQLEVAKATATAYKTAAEVQTTTLAENVKHIRELRYAFGNLDEATASSVIGTVSKANTVMRAATGHGYSDQIWDIVKSLEMTNKTLDPQEFQRYVDMMTRVVTATGGKVTPQQYFQAFKYGRTAAQGWDENFIGGALPRLIQSMGGGTGGGGGRAGPGNALMSVYAALVEGVMPKTANAEFSQLGLGSPKGTGEFSGKQLFMHDPYEWVQQVLMPALAKKGITGRDAVIGEISKLFQNRTASQAVIEMATQGRFMMGDQSMFEKDIRLQGNSMGLGAYDLLMNKDLQTNMQAFTSQWHSMLQALGSAMVPTAINVLKTFTGLFTDLTKFAGLHPDAIREIGKAIGALAVGLGVISAVALVTAIAPLVGAGGLIAGVAAALGLLAASHWDQIKSGLSGLADSLKSLWDKLKGVFSSNPGIMGNGSTTSYFGGAYAQPASFTTYGSSPSVSAGGGTASSPASVGGNVASSPSVSTPGGVGASAPHVGGGIASNPSSSVGRQLGSTPNAAALPMGNIPYSPAQVIGHLGGAPVLSGGPSGTNSWIAAQRAGFAKELQNPVIRGQVAAMLDAEGPTRGTLESLMNRASASGHSLSYFLTGPGRAFYSTRARIARGGRVSARDEAIIKSVLSGSDTIRGFTDQGLPTDPNAPFGHHHFNGPLVRQHGNIFNDWQAGRYAGWRKHFEDMAHAAEHVKEKEQVAVPPSTGHEVHVHHTTRLDGRIIAQNTVKHMVRQGNMQTVGTRLADYSITRPMPV